MTVEEKNTRILLEILGGISERDVSTIIVFLLKVRHHESTGESMKRTIVDVITAVGKRQL